LNVLVLGGSGFIGRSVCDRLVARSGGGSGRIVVPSRRPARAKHLQLLPTLVLREANLSDDAQLAGLVAGCDVVINLVAILHGSRADFQRVHVDLPGRLAGACAKAGVARIVHVSAIGVSAEAPSHYLRSKAAGEAAIASGPIRPTILRPSIVFGEHDQFLNLFASMQAIAPFVPLAGARAQFQPVWVEDVAEAIVRCADDDATAGRTFECTGPRVYTLRRLVEMAGGWSGHARPVIGLPDALARLQAMVFERLPGQLITRDNLDSLRVPNVASGNLPGLDALGIAAAALEAIAPTYLGVGDAARFDHWRARARRS
jgi:NADH dehydrogenase